MENLKPIPTNSYTKSIIEVKQSRLICYKAFAIGGASMTVMAAAAASLLLIGRFTDWIQQNQWITQDQMILGLSEIGAVALPATLLTTYFSIKATRTHNKLTNLKKTPLQNQQLEIDGTTHTISNQGKDHYPNVLSELDKLKKQLGGAPNYKRKRPPAIDAGDARQTILGLPQAAVKDLFRKYIRKGWGPQRFWELTAKFLIGFSLKVDETQYEYAAKAIQRFGILAKNKELFIAILKDEDPDYYVIFNNTTGLAWHPTDNSWGTEIQFIDFIHMILTTYFEKAKKKGDAALIEYFNAFEGVCFEDRCRALRDYKNKVDAMEASQKPASSTTPGSTAIQEVGDYDSNSNINDVLNIELKLLATNLKLEKGKVPSGKQMIDYLKTKGAFNKTFSDGTLSLETTHKWILKMQEDYTIDSYKLSDFFEIEYQILTDSNRNVTVDNFIEQIKARSSTYEIEIYPEGSEEEVDFEINEQEIKTWFAKQSTK